MVFGARSTKFANKNKIGSKTAPPGGAENGGKFNFDQFKPNLIQSIPE